MDINKFIEKNAGGDSEHDKAYAKALKNAYDFNKNLSKEGLLFNQQMGRDLYARYGTHKNTAMCVITYELLKEK